MTVDRRGEGFAYFRWHCLTYEGRYACWGVGSPCYLRWMKGKR